MLRIALTGGIGCGKSTVCELFRERGIPVIDTDVIARELVLPGMPALTKIGDIFGRDLINKNGELDRKKLAGIVFRDDQLKQQLESILHPLIRDEVERQIAELDSPYCIVAIPLLFETGQQKKYPHKLVIDCDPEQQLERTRARDERTTEQIQEIIDAQISRSERLKLADEIIDNRGTAEKLIPQVDALHRKFLKLANSSIQ